MSYRFKLRSMAIIEVEDSWSYIWIYVYLSWKWIRLSEALASNEMCYWKVVSKRELISPNLPQSQGISDLEVDQGWLGQKKKLSCFRKLARWKVFYHSPYAQSHVYQNKFVSNKKNTIKKQKKLKKIEK